jgi:hypothetical protein
LETENPCVAGSIPARTTFKMKQLRRNVVAAFFFGTTILQHFGDSCFGVL